MAPQRAVRVLSETIPPQSIVTLDTGDHTLWFNRIFENRGQRVLLSGRWRTLGFAVPAAIAARLSYPEWPVVALAGDGGVVQTLLEFKTAVRERLAIVVVVFNNGCYAIEKNRMEVAGLEPLGSTLDNPDFAAVAEACGGIGRKADTPEQLRYFLKEALILKLPTLIEVSVAAPRVPHTKI
jgi:pyruvate dehydrogenase (quinone)/pyruvate oxidase